MTDLTKESAPPASPSPAKPEDKPSGGALAFLFSHQSGIVIAVALLVALAIGAILIRYQGVSPFYAYETLVK